MRSHYLEANRLNWNDRADIHIKDSAGFYRLAALEAGQVLLTPIERGELGDITGLRVAHFQCHIGTDTISLERLGAESVTGLDFSSRAIAHARDLAARGGSAVQFVEGSVYDAVDRLGTGYDLVFTSWGTICWLQDLELWAQAIAGVLRPGGSFYFADGHPTAMIFELDLDGAVRARNNFLTEREAPETFDDGNTYDESGDKVAHTRTYEWVHPVSRILNALIGAGLVIETVAEHERVPWRMFSAMVPVGDGLYALPTGTPRLPLALTVRARKP
jgi:SAM-dependent methyltransferase